MLEAAYGENGIKEELSRTLGSRLLDPNEIARKIYFLCNQEKITGSIIPVHDGSLHLRQHKQKN